jgi:hypothetical protein
MFRMNCSEFEKTVLALAADRLMDAERRAALLRHTEICGRCDTLLREERALLYAVCEVRAAIAHERAPGRVEGVLLEAFRAQSRIGVTAATDKTPAWLNWKLAAVAAALVLVTAAGALVFLQRSAEAPKQAHTPAPATMPDAALPPAVKDPEPQRVPVHVERRARTRRARPSETVTEFMPLNEGEDLQSFEFVQVVRVELSASSLRDFDLPAGYASTDELVKADLALGPDGIARAIRFVR